MGTYFFDPALRPSAETMEILAAQLGAGTRFPEAEAGMRREVAELEGE